jgi:hypothetical protein
MASASMPYGTPGEVLKSQNAKLARIAIARLFDGFAMSIESSS